LGDDDGPVFDTGVGEGPFGDPFRIVETGTDLRVDLRTEPVPDVDDETGIDGRRWPAPGTAVLEPPTF
jgi:hypothetical protein